ncbi:hypothetical protein FLL45_04540 [Aliikangiella marina]|uniref:Uncharacterized protein n=1 Tax=Aliikangiella marina TaxID=1712262 RepID=A0A545TJ09_9GAMM|nr:hypothetical protein [Aliikangiella marina]TQV77219.1 hypothetical protein FLL45_04540 [Aliikangiella marina]
MKLKNFVLFILFWSVLPAQASDLLMARFNEPESVSDKRLKLKSQLRANEVCTLRGTPDLEKLTLQAECLRVRIEQQNGSSAFCEAPPTPSVELLEDSINCLKGALQTQLLSNAKAREEAGVLFEPKIGIDDNKLTPSISFSTMTDFNYDSNKSQFYFEFKANAQAEVAEAEELANTIVINDANLHFELGYMFKYTGSNNESIFSDWTLSTSYTYGLATTNELSQNDTTLDVESEISSFQLKLMYSFKDVHILYELDDYEAQGDVDNSEFLSLIDGKKSKKIKVSIPFESEADKQKYYLTFTRSKLDDTSKPIFRAEISTSF